MPSSAADSSNTSFETSLKGFSRSRKIVAERKLYPLLRAVIGAAVCISIEMTSIVLTPLLKPREYGLIGWADYLTQASTNHSMTFEKAGSSGMGRCVLSLFEISIISAIFHLVGSLPSENDWLMNRMKRCLVASGTFLMIEEQTVSSPGAVYFKRCSTSPTQIG